MPPPSFPSLGNATKLLVPLALGAGGFGIGFLLYMGKAQEAGRLQQQLSMSQQQAAQMEAKNQELIQQISGIQSERKTLDEKIASLRSQLSSATDDLDRSRASLKEFETRYQVLTEERNKLETRVAEVTGERDEARKRADRMAQEKADLERTTSRARERAALLDRDYRALSEKLAELQSASQPTTGLVTSLPPASPTVVPSVDGTSMSATTSSIPGTVELPPIIVRKDRVDGSSSIRGRLIEVDGPHNFVVVDKGSADGVRVGMAFDILRGSSTVGRATVIRVRPALSACDVVLASPPGPLQVGDLAIQNGL